MPAEEYISTVTEHFEKNLQKKIGGICVPSMFLCPRSEPNDFNLNYTGIFEKTLYNLG